MLDQLLRIGRVKVRSTSEKTVTLFEETRINYVRTHLGSEDAIRRLAEVLPGGDTRTTTWFDPFPVVMDSAAGYTLTDVNGNRLIDFLGNYTALVHGHRPSFVVDAIRDALDSGWLFGAPLAEQEHLGRALKERVESVDLVRFTNSGTEASLLALRLARALTGRRRVAVARHSYHGSSDSLRAESPDVVVFPYDDVDGTIDVLDAARDDLAAVFVEPVLGSGGVIPAQAEFLRVLRDWCSSHSVLLVFDEVMSFRLAYGGLQLAYNINPDLTVFGKIIGGGLPIGAVGGKHDILEVSAPGHASHFQHGGTFNGNRLAMVAGLAALLALNEAEIARINRLGERLRSQLREVIEQYQAGLSVTGIGSLLNLHAAPRVTTPEAAVAASGSLLARYLHLALINQGIFLAPRGEMCICTPMEEAAIDAATEAFASACAALPRTPMSARLHV